MNYFENTLEKIKKNQQKKQSGVNISFPFGISNLDEFHPGFTKSLYVLISSLQKTGKTQFLNYLIINFVNFVKNQQNLKLKILYFSLEMTETQIITQIMSYRLFDKHRLRYSTRELLSLFKDKFIEDNIIKYIEEDKLWFDFFQDNVDIITHIKNPFGVYKYVKDYLKKPEIGKYTTNEKYEFYNKNTNTFIKGTKETNYQYNDENLFIFVVVDNYNNFVAENNGTKFESIGKWSNEYAIELRNENKCIIIGIQQQSSETNNIEAHKIKRIEPSAENLKDNKSTVNDVDMFITLFSPYRAQLNNYNNYDIQKLKDFYRLFEIHFDRNGIPLKTNLFFDGCVNFFTPLPKTDDLVQLDKFYKTAEKYNLKNTKK